MRTFLLDRQLLDSFAKTCNISHPSDWGKVRLADVIKFTGKGLIIRNGCTLSKLLRSVYPETNWKRDWFQYKKSWGFWNRLSNHRLAFDEFAKTHGIHSFEGWKNISLNTVHKHGLRPLLDEYGGSLRSALLEVYKDIEWKPEWLPGPTFGGSYWTQKNHQKDLLTTIAKKLDIKNPKEWGSVTRRQIYKLGARSVVGYYHKGSVMKAVMTLFPEVPWQRKWFTNVPLYSRSHWDEYNHQRAFLDQIAIDFGISTMKDWSRVTKSLIMKKGGHGLLQRYHYSLVKLIESVYRRDFLNDWVIPKEHRKLEFSLNRILEPE